LLTFFVSGRWEEMAGIEEDAREFALEVTQALKHHDKQTVRALFGRTKQALMSNHGKWSFERVQQEPAFSEFGLQNMIRLVQAWKAAGDAGFRQEWNRTFTAGWQRNAPAHRVVTIRGGPGDSAETAFVLDAPDVETRVAAEHWYLYYTYGEAWQLELQKLIGQHDVLRLSFPDSASKDVFFDRRCGDANGFSTHTLYPA
jgi:hypothetical protein